MRWIDLLNTYEETSAYVKILKAMLVAAVDEAYQSEVVETGMETLIIGSQYEDKEDWQNEKLTEWATLKTPSP